MLTNASADLRSLDFLDPTGCPCPGTEAASGQAVAEAGNARAQSRDLPLPAQPSGTLAQTAGATQANHPCKEAAPQLDHAENLRQMTAAAYLYSSMVKTLGSTIDITEYQIFRDRLLDDAGQPGDPVEVMLIEQLALAHHNIGRLFIR